MILQKLKCNFCGDVSEVEQTQNGAYPPLGWAYGSISKPTEKEYPHNGSGKNATLKTIHMCPKCYDKIHIGEKESKK